MAMRFPIRIVRHVLMLVMSVMHVAMLVLERLMQMLVVVRLGKMQIHANPHEQCRASQIKCGHLAEQRERKGRADKGSCGKVSAGACNSQVPQAQHKEHQAYPVAEEADRGRGGECCGSRQRSTTSERQREIDGAGSQSLDHGNLQRIGRAELAREIVVDTPRHAGKND